MISGAGVRATDRRLLTDAALNVTLRALLAVAHIITPHRFGAYLGDECRADSVFASCIIYLPALQLMMVLRILNQTSSANVAPPTKPTTSSRLCSSSFCPRSNGPTPTEVAVAPPCRRAAPGLKNRRFLQTLAFVPVDCCKVIALSA